MTIQELFEAYREATVDSHYGEDDYQFDPEDFNWVIDEEVQ